jgi:hypothetical protein
VRAGRRRTRLVAALAAVLAAGLLGGCGNTVTGRGSAPTIDLGNRLQHAMDAVSSAHVELQAELAGVVVAASGDQKLNNGRTTAFALTEHILGAGATGVHTIKVVDVGGALYARLPTDLNPTEKPWVRINPGTTDPTLAPLAQALQQIQSSASLKQYALLARAASHLRDVGPSEANGVATELYSFGVLVGRLPASVPGAATLRASGVQSLPVQLWVDDQGRVRRLSESVTFAGQRMTTRVDLSRFDAPVTISAPPADQVATR